MSPDHPVAAESSKTMITFVIPAHKEERLLGPTLDAIHVAAKPIDQPYELIVADDASTDSTASVAERHGARVVRVDHRQIAGTRNAGAREGNGEVLFFVDADTAVTEDLVRAAAEALRDGAVTGGATARFDGRVPVYARVLIGVGIRLQRIVRLGSGCFLFCTRQAFDAVGGFDERLYAFEDIVMCRRLKRHGRFVVLREAVTTSGRNLRAHSGLDALRMLTGFVTRGPGFFRSRQGLDFWYHERRDDPEHPAD